MTDRTTARQAEPDPTHAAPPTLPGRSIPVSGVAVPGRAAAFRAGLRAELPLLIGVAPFGLIYGALAMDAGLGRAASQLMSSIVFAGSAQFVAADLFADGAPALVILLTVAVVNLRHLLYSASMAPYLAHLPLRWKIGLSYLLTDEAYAPSILELERRGMTATSHWFVLGAGLGLWTTWQTSTALGIWLGAAIPASWPLDFALPITFIGMVVPTLVTAPLVAAAASAGVVATLAHGLPFKLGLVLAAVSGIAAGTMADRASGGKAEGAPA